MYRTKLSSMLNDDALDMLTELVSNLTFLRSGKMDQEFDDRIWEQSEKIRKMTVLREKGTSIMREDHQLLRIIGERGSYRKKRIELEQSLSSSILQITKILIQGTTTMLSELEKSVDALDAKRLISACSERIKTFNFSSGNKFREELENLAESLGDVEIGIIRQAKAESPLSMFVKVNDTIIKNAQDVKKNFGQIEVLFFKDK